MTEPNNVGALIKLLCSKFPRAFFLLEARRVPLKLRIDLDIRARLGDAVSAKELGKALGCYTANQYYLAASVASAVRFDLDGNVAGTVTADEAVFALERRAKAKATAAACGSPGRQTAAGDAVSQGARGGG
jgi:ProP effector